MTEDGGPAPDGEHVFYAAVGKAITSWAHLDEILFQITLSILDCSNEHAAIVFYRTPGIESRLTLTDDLVVSCFHYKPGKQPPAELKAWRKFELGIRANLKTRNHLAHHPVGPVVQITHFENEKEEAEIRHGSFVPSNERQKKREQSKEYLGLEDILIHNKNVSEITRELENFYRLHFARRRAGYVPRGCWRENRRDKGSLPEGELLHPPAASLP